MPERENRAEKIPPPEGVMVFSRREIEHVFEEMPISPRITEIIKNTISNRYVLTEPNGRLTRGTANNRLAVLDKLIRLDGVYTQSVTRVMVGRPEVRTEVRVYDVPATTALIELLLQTIVAKKAGPRGFEAVCKEIERVSTIETAYELRTQVRAAAEALTQHLIQNRSGATAGK